MHSSKTPKRTKQAPPHESSHTNTAVVSTADTVTDARIHALGGEREKHKREEKGEARIENGEGETTNVMEKVAMSGHNWAFRVINSKRRRSAHAVCVNAVLQNLRTAS